MKRLLAVLVVAATGVLATSHLATGAGMEGVGPAGVSTKLAPFDQQFIDMMAVHHKMAIDMAQMVLQHAKHAETKTLARKIISAQSKEIAAFHQLRKQWYGQAAFKSYKLDEMMMRSMGMGPESEMMNAVMMSSRPDYEFLSEMIPHHAGAITMAQWELKSGTHAKLKQIAANIIHDQSKEIGEMIQLRTSWYGA
jgi:uncharacterized protein (DUF305 family)